MENNSQAIEIKGIVRNQTKIGVQDGQCDDIVNLRFKDGSWRVADDGKQVYSLPKDYTQLYVHTNVYHHLLGVLNDKLWYFADIENDGETFTPLDTPVEICDVKGDVTIVQNGHLLTIVANQTDTTRLPSTTSGEQQKHTISYSIFKTSTKEYKELKVNPNGEQTDRGLYPFGRAHLNLDCDYNDEKEFKDENIDAGYISLDSSDIYYPSSGSLVPQDDEGTTKAAAQLWHSSMLKAFNAAKENNYFTRPLMAIVAVKLYDGSYSYASNPIILSPREKFSSHKCFYNESLFKDTADINKLFFQRQGVILNETIVDSVWYDYEVDQLSFYEGSRYKVGAYTPPYINGASSVGRIKVIGEVDYTGYESQTPLTSCVLGSNLILTLGNLDTILNNKDIFTGISIFITDEADIYDMSAEGYKEGKFYVDIQNKKETESTIAYHTVAANIVYRPKIRTDKEIIYDLINSPFYLLREYNINELKTMANTATKVDLSDVKYNGLLKNIAQQDTLPSEVFGRNEFIPKVVYQYNQKLHIANYKTTQFHGFPIDCFQFSNHNVKVKSGSYACGGVLPNLEDGADVQYPREKFYFIGDITDVQQYVDKALEYGYFFAAITVSLETSQGEQNVVRYIKPYRADEFKDGDQSNFIESLSPLITFPDSRAKKMTISFVRAGSESSILLKTATYQLTPHPYLNLAYYINSDLKPLSAFATRGTTLESFLSGEYSNYYTPDTEQNNTEEYPNGLKVSLTNNPFTFPYESTYQVGSSEIVALMSNAVAVGTGQTGAAPLYVFCKDGIYSLMVDSSGEMTYTNARIIARDVCNNAKSVTPIDSGVVFTTDRGIMSIAGSEVVEIGSAAEGDVFDITDTSDKAKKIMFNAFTMPQLAEFPQSLIDNTDFLTYIKGAIVNYNHNERELMVSNPSKDYTYVMDRNGNWSRRAFTAQEYVNNYPTSYRIDKAGNFYKVDADDNDTNKVYLLSNVIKLGTIAFKQAYRLVVRGYFETDNDSALGIYVFSSSSGNKWKLVGGNEKSGKFSDIGCKVSHDDTRFLRVCIAGKLSKDTRIDYIEVSADGSALNGKLR